MMTQNLFLNRNYLVQGCSCTPTSSPEDPNPGLSVCSAQILWWFIWERWCLEQTSSYLLKVKGQNVAKARRLARKWDSVFKVRNLVVELSTKLSQLWYWADLGWDPRCWDCSLEGDMHSTHTLIAQTLAEGLCFSKVNALPQEYNLFSICLS